MKNPAILPWSLLTLRLISGPILLFDALDGETDLSFVALLALAILSDILDGILARRAGVDTQFFRRTDSIVDSALFLFVAAAAWIAHQDLLMQSRALVFGMLGLWLLSQFPALIKFGRLPAYHAYSAKAAGLALLAAGVGLFGFSRAGLVLEIALWVAILSNLERILITVILPTWQTDVNGYWVALAIRKAAAQ